MRVAQAPGGCSTMDERTPLLRKMDAIGYKINECL